MGKPTELLQLLKTGNSDAARKLLAKMKKSGKFLPRFIRNLFMSYKLCKAMVIFNALLVYCSSSWKNVVKCICKVAALCVRNVVFSCSTLTSKGSILYQSQLELKMICLAVE